MTSELDAVRPAEGHVAAGGARRGVLGLVAGLVFGLVARLALSPRRPGQS